MKCSEIIAMIRISVISRCFKITVVSISFFLVHFWRDFETFWRFFCFLKSLCGIGGKDFNLFSMKYVWKCFSLNRSRTFQNLLSELHNSLLRLNEIWSYLSFPRRFSSILDLMRSFFSSLVHNLALHAYKWCILIM